MTSVEIRYPPLAPHRGPGFWTNIHNLWTGRRRLFRQDSSNQWRYDFEQTYRNRAPSSAAIAGAATDPTARSVPFARLLSQHSVDGFRFLILGDTGEGDHSQYGLLPLIRALKPDFMIINGDVAYPAGDREDFDIGFFTPYRGLGIPIWAVPGNHEYYSNGHGAEFYELFCTTLHAARWSGAGLRLVPQPGTYWELKEPGGACPLIVIGIDSGQEGNLDGRGHEGDWFNPFQPRPQIDWSDPRQHEWLDWRLTLADREKARVIALFHIPALVNGESEGKIGLVRVHQILASHPSVRLVVSAHIHNYQQYAPDVFRRYLVDRTGVALPAETHYVVCGNGGAGLSATKADPGRYPAFRFPDKEQWKEYSTVASRLMARLRLNRTVVEGVVRLFDKAAGLDPDEPVFLSMVLVEVKGREVTATPVCLKDLNELVNDPTIPQPIDPPGTVLEVANPGHRLSDEAAGRCLMPKLVIQV